MKIDKKEHSEFLIEVVQSIKFGGTLEQIEDTTKIAREVLEAIKNADITEK
ncbi:hypothetical protein ACTNEO_19895 [Gracilibacillus sp. HCP3S3_G5_1]|uniref:hypothetical protein n=1 Tax=unclassified Gracilibacillus TaxID=2625209 RepID=UPI003F8B25E4